LAAAVVILLLVQVEVKMVDLAVEETEETHHLLEELVLLVKEQMAALDFVLLQTKMNLLVVAEAQQ
jgi:hypothetical protein